MYGKATATDLVGPNLGGVEPQEFPGWGKQCEPDWWSLRYGIHLLALWLCVAEGSEEEQWPLPTILSGRKLSLSSHPDATHFSSFLYAPAAFQAATPVLELRESEFE